MLVIVNFVAIFVVSAVVAFQLYETITKYKAINTKLTELEEEDVSTKSSIVKARKDLSSSITEASSQLNDKVNATEYQFNKQIENTHTFVTDEFNKAQKERETIKTQLSATQTDLNNVKTSNKTLDDYFKSLSQQVVTKNTTTDKLKLGNKFQLSGIGDAKGNDDWLRLFDGDGKDFYGGLATKKLWVDDQTYLNNDVNVAKGKINFQNNTPGPMIEKSNEKVNDRYGVGQFANGAMRMYASGLYQPATAGLSVLKPDGTLDDVLAVTTDKLTNVYGNMDIRGKLFLGRVDGSTDPYSIEKKLYAKDKSSLRLTINDNSNETVEIWGDSCGTGNCAGEGTLKHRFQANGDAQHEGNLQVKKRLLVNRSPSDKYPAWGDGVHTSFLYANDSIGVGNDGDVAAAISSSGTVQAKKMCIDNVCLDAEQLNTIKTQANL